MFLSTEYSVPSCVRASHHRPYEELVLYSMSSERAKEVNWKGMMREGWPDRVGHPAGWQGEGGERDTQGRAFKSSKFQTRATLERATTAKMPLDGEKNKSCLCLTSAYVA
jgi:hypothetical protein